MKNILLRAALAAWFTAPATLTVLPAEDPKTWPDCQEVLELIRTQLPEVKPDDLNRALIEGLLQRLPSQIQLVTELPETNRSNAGNGLAQSRILDHDFGYLRIAGITAELPDQFATALERLSRTNSLKGLIIDLRYAAGSDYAGAARLADLFLTEERLLLSLPGEKLRSTGRTNAWQQPVAVLINQGTAEAAEALAAILREGNVALLLGSPSAGRGRVFRSFPLKNGQQLRLATSPVLLGEDKQIPPTGLAPDIVVSVSPTEEEAYYANAYYRPRKLAEAALPGGDATNTLTAASTNRASRRVNEAELVRRQREGIASEVDSETAPVPPPEPELPTITDPALARALDLLKGLMVVQKSRPSTFRR